MPFIHLCPRHTRYVTTPFPPTASLYDRPKGISHHTFDPGLGSSPCTKNVTEHKQESEGERLKTWSKYTVPKSTKQRIRKFDVLTLWSNSSSHFSCPCCKV
ncbi:hypothetical protein RB195_014265 [Necator americanus]|uniref:Uncharacterized protein n=1 Tax=Necator americanus TaxID=51031 RepID=A0ABR1DZE1_NECAM